MKKYLLRLSCIEGNDTKYFLQNYSEQFVLLTKEKIEANHYTTKLIASNVIRFMDKHHAFEFTIVSIKLK